MNRTTLTTMRPGHINIKLKLVCNSFEQVKKQCNTLYDVSRKMEPK